MVNKRSLIFIFFLGWILSGCKEKGGLSSPIFLERDIKTELKDYEALLEKDPSFNNFQTGMLKISNMLVDTQFVDQKKEILQKGLDWCKKYENETYGLVLKKEFVKEFPSDKQSEKYLIDLVSVMDEDSKELEVRIIYDGILKRWPQNKIALEKSQMIKRDPKEFDYFLEETGKQMFGTPEKFVINTARVQQYISLSESYALAYPSDVRTPEILMRSAQAAKTGSEQAKAIELFDWVYQIYPDSDHAANALFLKGFTYETETEQKDLAILSYRTFLKKFPAHPRAKEVSFLLENINTPEAELIKKLEN